VAGIVLTVPYNYIEIEEFYSNIFLSANRYCIIYSRLLSKKPSWFKRGFLWEMRMYRREWPAVVELPMPPAGRSLPIQ
jgi:hypothetical protein